MKFLKKLLIIIPINFYWEDDPIKCMCDFHIQTAEILSKQNIVILFLTNQPIPVREAIAKRKFFHKHSRSIFIFRPIEVPGHSKITSILSRLITKFIFFLIQTKYKLIKKVLWLFEPSYGHLFDDPFYRHMTSIYDCVDPWGYLWDKKSERNLFNLEKKTLQHANFMFVNSHVLRSLHSQTRDLYVVPQGFKYQHFQSQSLKKRKRSDRITVGFIGNIGHGDRIDWVLISQIASQTPHIRYVFYGYRRDQLKQKYQDLVSKNSNIFLLNPVPSDQIAKKISSFDICMIPYITTRKKHFPDLFNKYCYPMKVFEYLYMGKPVLSTSIVSLENLSPLIHIGDTHIEWINNIHKIIENPISLQEQRSARRLAESQSWENKVVKIDEILSSLIL